MTFGELVDIVFRDLRERDAEFIGARRDVPEDIAKLVFELRPDLFVDHAAVVTLDLFDDVRDLARFAR